MALINLDELIKGTKKIVKIESKALGGSIEAHKIPAQQINSLVNKAKEQARKNIAKQLDITPIELISLMSQNEELREEVDLEFRTLLAIEMVKAYTAGTQTEITDEIAQNLSQEVLTEIMNAIFEKFGAEEGTDSDKDDDIKN